MTTFSVVATPIGNMGDITLRALETLKNVDVVLCEDTRVTRKLLDRYSIQAHTLSYHSHSSIQKVDDIVSQLKKGNNIALVSDAGTPGISDPGAELVRRIRNEMQVEISHGELKIESIPGPSALTAALSIAGVSAGDFTFLGFLPHKKGRETLFKEIAASKRSMVFYESPHRIGKTLNSLVEHLAGTDKKVVICRELTKIFEEVVSGSADMVRTYFTSNPEKIRGEFVIIV